MEFTLTALIRKREVSCLCYKLLSEVGRLERERETKMDED